MHQINFSITLKQGKQSNFMTVPMALEEMEKIEMVRAH